MPSVPWYVLIDPNDLVPECIWLVMVSGRQIQLPAQRAHFVVGFKLIILSSFLLQKAFDHGF
jgi:hypothetical protein